MRPSALRTLSRRGQESCARVKDAIRHYAAHGNVAPTLEELAVSAQMSRSNVKYYLDYLAAAGVLHKGAYRRELRLDDEAADVCG